MSKKSITSILIALIITPIVLYVGFRLHVDNQFVAQYPYMKMNTKLRFLKPKLGWNSFKI